MQNVSIKRLVVFRNHIFPEVRKPLRSMIEYLSVKNPDLDRLKVRKMKQILDEEEKKRIRSQTSLMNEQINVGLQKYYLKYIQPFQSCPDYYRLLFSYARKKLEWIGKKASLREERFFLGKKQVKNILKLLNKGDEQKSNHSPQINNNSSQVQKNSKEKCELNEEQQQARNKLLLEVYRQLYPSQKALVYSHFAKLYKQFLTKEQTISQQLLQTNIIHLKPFLYRSPVEVFQARNPESSLKECQNYLIDHQKQRQSACLEFANIIQERQKEIEFIAERFKVSPTYIRRPLYQQYIDSRNELSFYNLLKQRKQ